jgi:hypothetical protein
LKLWWLLGIIAVVLICVGIFSGYFFERINEKNIHLNMAVSYVYPAITDEKVLPTSKIPDQYISNIINVKASPGEFRPASFVIYALQDISSMTAKISDLTGPRGKIRKDSIDVHIVKCWYQSGLDVHETKSKIMTPELLLKDDSLVKIEDGQNYVKLKNGSYKWISDPTEAKPGATPASVADTPIEDNAALLPVDIEAGTNQQFWITLKVPEDADPGKYTGIIKLTISEGIIAEFELNLDVLPITLSDPALKYSIYYTGVLDTRWPQGSISGTVKSESQFKKEMQNLVEHGIPNPTVYQSFDTTLLNKVLEIRKNSGMNNSSIYYLGLTPWGYQPVDEVKKVNAFMRAHGVNDVYYYGEDEASGTELTDQRASWKAVREAGGKIFAAGKSVHGDATGNFALMGDITDLFISRGEPQQANSADWHSSGHQIFSYANPQVGMELPETYRRNYGLLLWQKNYDGAMDWAYQSGFGYIWNDFDNPDYRDEVFTYPTDNGVIDTIQWEGFREGVNDIRYISTLLDAINRAKTKGKDVSAAENWLKNLKEFDLTAINLDSVREEMIGYILSLQ